MPWLTLIEMTCVAWQWMVFADPPHTIRPSLPKPESRFVWANPRADTANLGKLPLLEFERVFNPTQSIEPAEVERIRFADLAHAHAVRETVLTQTCFSALYFAVR